MSAVKFYTPRVSNFVTAGGAPTQLQTTHSGLIVVTGTAVGHSFALPPATNLKAGQVSYRFVNASTQTFSVVSGSFGFLAQVLASTILEVELKDGGSAAGSWFTQVLPEVRKAEYSGVYLGTSVAAEAYLAKAPASSLPVPLVHPSGYESGYCSPFFVTKAQQIVEIQAICSATAVSQGTVGASPTLRIDVYGVGIDGSAILTDGTVRLVPEATTDIGVSNTLPANPSAPIVFSKVLATPIALPAGSLFGYVFQNESTDNQKINAAANLVVTAITEFT